MRLVGDTAQLSSPAAGGILHDLVRAHGAVALDTRVRFADPAEAAATLAIRTGDPAGLNFYMNHGRIHPATTSGDVPTPDVSNRAGSVPRGQRICAVLWCARSRVLGPWGLGPRPRTMPP